MLCEVMKHADAQRSQKLCRGLRPDLTSADVAEVSVAEVKFA
jgi:hypothetical protein